MPDTADILQFWFVDTKPEQWFRADEDFDAEIAERFGETHQQALRGELYPWRREPSGRLAEVILLDQFSRNIKRGTVESFAADPMALILAQEAIAGGHDQAVEMMPRTFLYMPYMHSESRAIQQVCLQLFAALGNDNALNFARQHADIIDRFGRFPHRNQILGRKSTPEEQEFLKTHSGF